MIEMLLTLAGGALLGMVIFFYCIIRLHDKYGLPIPAVDVAIVAYITLLAALFGVATVLR